VNIDTSKSECLKLDDRNYEYRRVKDGTERGQRPLWDCSACDAGGIWSLYKRCCWHLVIIQALLVATGHYTSIFGGIWSLYKHCL
jgi:hypothetical protein